MIVIDRKAACGNHAMDVRVQQQILSPRMEDADHANLGAEMFLIGGQYQCRRSAGPEQQLVEMLADCLEPARLVREAR